MSIAIYLQPYVDYEDGNITLTKHLLKTRGITIATKSLPLIFLPDDAFRYCNVRGDPRVIDNHVSLEKCIVDIQLTKDNNFYIIMDVPPIVTMGHITDSIIDNYQAGAADTWMEGDITISKGVELKLGLSRIVIDPFYEMQTGCAVKKCL